MNTIPIRADELKLGMSIRLEAAPGLPASTEFVTSLVLTGDDVVINGIVTTSKGNAVPVLAADEVTPERATQILDCLSVGWESWCTPVNRAIGHLVEGLRANGQHDDVTIKGIVSSLNDGIEAGKVTAADPEDFVRFTGTPDDRMRQERSQWDRLAAIDDGPVDERWESFESSIPRRSW